MTARVRWEAMREQEECCVGPPSQQWPRRLHTLAPVSPTSSPVGRGTAQSPHCPAAGGAGARMLPDFRAQASGGSDPQAWALVTGLHCYSHGLRLAESWMTEVTE